MTYVIVGVLLLVVWFVFFKNKDKPQKAISKVDKIDYTSKFLKMTNNFCPYCNQAYDTPILRKRKCHHCNELIYVSTVNKISYVFTEENYNNFKYNQKRQYFVNRWLRELYGYDIKLEDFLKNKRIFEERNKIEAKDSDIVWGLFNQLITKTEISEVSSLYYIMSKFLYEEGKNHLRIAQLSKEFELRDYRKQGATKVEIMGCGESCKKCAQLNNKIFTISEALKSKPLPCKDCEYELIKGKPGWCRCSYLHFLE